MNLKRNDKISLIIVYFPSLQLVVKNTKPENRITAISRSGMVTIRTRRSSGSGVSSRFIPAGITNDIDPASETTGAVMGIFWEFMTGAVIGIFFPGFIAAGYAGKEQVKPCILLSSIDRGKHHLRVAPELDLSGRSRDCLWDSVSRRLAEQQGQQQDHRNGTDHDKYCAHAASWDGSDNKWGFPAKGRSENV